MIGALLRHKCSRKAVLTPMQGPMQGAIGLMQLMPATGKQLGFSRLKNPKTNIHAGTKYMNWLFDKFDTELPVVDRMWFTLASYNAGLGHVLDARRLAGQLGLMKIDGLIM